MTPATSTSSGPARTPDRTPRSELDLAAQQLRSIERFNHTRQLAEAAAAAAARSREMRMDAARRIEVLRREHDALVARAHAQLQSSGHLLYGTSYRRVVLAHRNEWFVGKVADALEEHGLVVVARLDNGADVVGLAVAEQPDLVLVEDTLAMVPGEQVVREIREFCPGTVLAAQVPYGDRVGPMLDAGAATVFTRQVPPLDVAAGLLAQLAV